MERVGWIGNFDRAAAGTIAGGHAGIEFVDSEVYKLLEAMAWELGREPNRRDLDAPLPGAGANGSPPRRSPTGTCTPASGGPGSRRATPTWSPGTSCTASVTCSRRRSPGCGPATTTCCRRWRAAWRITSTTSSARTAGSASAVTRRSRWPWSSWPARPASTATSSSPALLRRAPRRRHARPAPVRAGVLPGRHPGPRRRPRCAATRCARSTSPRARSTWRRRPATTSWPPRFAAQWANGVARRTYITGGVGSHHQDEAFGDDFELPADRAYAETCAGIASVMLSWRLLLATGEDKYADLIERTLLNNVLASPRADGRAFYYTNTLHQRTPGPVPRRGPGQPPGGVGAARRPGSRSPAARPTSRARWRASACTSRPPATTASSCTSTATTGCRPSWPAGAVTAAGVQRLPGRRRRSRSTSSRRPRGR